LWSIAEISIDVLCCDHRFFANPNRWFSSALLLRCSILRSSFFLATEGKPRWLSKTSPPGLNDNTGLFALFNSDPRIQPVSGRRSFG
jgi:hypothetical protein